MMLKHLIILRIYTTEDAVLGNFKDKDGNHAFMITNFADQI